MSGNRYEIRTVEDFLKVPPERLKDCLEGFAHVVVRSQALKLAMEARAQQSGAQVTADLFRWRSFTWIDDGKRDVTLEMTASTETGGAG